MPREDDGRPPASDPRQLALQIVPDAAEVVALEVNP